MPKKTIFDKYETYDPTIEGFGNPDQWRTAFTRAVTKSTPIDEAYQILGVTRNSTLQEIKTAYRILAKQYHPDKNNGDIETFQKLNQAYKSVIENLSFARPIYTRTTTQSSSSIMPQLLNEIEETEIEKYITDLRYCAQEKHNGRRKILKYKHGIVDSINKKGKIVGCPQIIEDDCNEIASLLELQEFTLDGEEVSDEYFVFDILILNSQDLRDKSYKERTISLFNVPDKSIKKVYTAYTENEKRELFNNLKTNNKEGIVFKLLSGKHKSGYSDDQVKFKFYATASVVVIRHNVQDSVGIAIYSNALIPIGNVTMIGHTKPPIGTVIEVKYLYAYRGGCLYQPSFIGIRDDVNVKDCTIEKLKFKN